MDVTGRRELSGGVPMTAAVASPVRSTSSGPAPSRQRYVAAVTTGGVRARLQSALAAAAARPRGGRRELALRAAAPDRYTHPPGAGSRRGGRDRREAGRADLYAWLTTADMVRGLALAETTPGRASKVTTDRLVRR
jgi:hypothetical protein